MSRIADDQAVGGHIDDARREMRALAIEHARKLLRRDPDANVPDVEVYACKRYGGLLLDVVDVPSRLAR